MIKHITLSIVAVLIAGLVFSSCQKRQLCVCTYKGERDTIILQEYRGYKPDEAVELCETDAQASKPGLEISCRIR